MPPRHAPESRAHWAVAYFRSGWAFLVPYVLLYFAYAWLKWPVNPAAGAEGASSSPLPAPCSLLHFYWFLHGLHLILGAIALRAWRLDPSGLRSPVSILQNVIPWLGLALLFWIPGVYLEFPADPWQHLARTNEWVWLDQVTDHSYWNKSSYFLAYSLVGRISPPVTQLRWFDLYYTGCCLLLCWQYYRLARAVGLSERSSLLFVLLNALVFGNNLFGFYRYYGMSSTVFAQLGAVALTRVALGALGGARSREQGAGSEEPIPSPLSRHSSLVSRPWSLVSGLLLLAITAGNHLQGLLIASAGVAAVVCWRLVAWRRSMIGWLALTAVIASVATVLWWPRHPLLDSNYRPDGWLTSWYAFNLFQPSSAGFQRAWVMIGAFGGLNLAAAIWLLCRNHVAGWLTLMPVLLLCLPCFALPFANSLAGSTDWDSGYIIAFHRILLAIPAGLALVVVLGGREQGAGSTEGGERRVLNGRQDRVHAPFSLPFSPFYLVLVSLVAFTALPANAPSFNRLYSDLKTTADDLSLRHAVDSPKAAELRAKVLTAQASATLATLAIEHAQLLPPPAVAYVMNGLGAMNTPRAQKNQGEIGGVTAVRYAEAIRQHGRSQRDFLLFQASDILYSPRSTMASLSGHWMPHTVALDHVGQPQLLSLLSLPIAARQPPQIWMQWYSPRDGKRIFAAGAGANLSTPPLDERGRLDSGSGNQVVQTGDRIVFQPVMRTFDGSGLRLHATITGPAISITRDIWGRPSAPGEAQWVYEDIPVTLVEPGRYNIELAGTTLGSGQRWTVRYHVLVQPAKTSPESQ